MANIDRYTKTLLTIIAVSLIGINAAMWMEIVKVKPAYAATSVYVTNADDIGRAVYIWSN